MSSLIEEARSKGIITAVQGRLAALRGGSQSNSGNSGIFGFGLLGQAPAAPGSQSSQSNQNQPTDFQLAQANLKKESPPMSLSPAEWAGLSSVDRQALAHPQTSGSWGYISARTYLGSLQAKEKPFAPPEVNPAGIHVAWSR